MPAIELYRYPDTGTATISTYSRRCVACATIVLSRPVPGGNGGGVCVGRHTKRRMTSNNTVTPIHLCQEKYFSLAIVIPGISVITQPNAKPPMMPIAINQCRAIAGAE